MSRRQRAKAKAIVVEVADHEIDARKLEAMEVIERWSRAGLELRETDPDMFARMFALAEGYCDRGFESAATHRARIDVIDGRTTEGN